MAKEKPEEKKEEPKEEKKEEETEEEKPEKEEKEKKPRAEGKKPKAKEHIVKIHSLYDTSGELKRKNKPCPKCGAGVFMAQHKDRSTCGKCGYTEFSSKKPEEKKG